MRRLTGPGAACVLALLACSPAANPAAGATLAAPGAATLAPTVAPSATAATAQPTPAGATGGIRFVPGSSQKVCQLVGETDRETNQPTANQTETRWGLTGNDLGYSFEHDGKLFFVFGDSSPTRAFNGRPNGPNSPNRNPDDNDAIAYTTDTAIGTPTSGVCPRLTFIHYDNGAFKNPVVLGGQGQPAITLRTDEIPVAGLSDGGHLYVFFATDNPVYQSGGPSPGNLGYAARSVVGVSDDDGNTFHYLYDFSKGPAARFVNIAAAPGQDNEIYFWGTPGGDLYRRSPPFLARKPIGSLGNLSGLEYLHGLDAGGTPGFMPGESNATALFHDTLPDAAGQPQSADCLGELGVTWNAFLSRWLMLYNCAGRGPDAMSGVYLRVAQQPWGPWSDPQIIFNAQRDGGYCHFIHRAVTGALSKCDDLAAPNQIGDYGGNYGPYVLSRYTTGDSAHGTTTIDYTLSTWIPYTEVIMQTTLQRMP